MSKVVFGVDVGGTTVKLGCFNTEGELLESYFEELSQRLSVPVAGGFKISHGAEKITLPIGKQAKIEGKNLTVL